MNLMQHPKLRLKTYRALEIADSRSGRVLNILLMILIVGNVIAVVLESVAPIYRDYEAWFSRFEIVSVAVFTVEYLARLWASAEADHTSSWRARVRYACTPMALIDLMAILPFYLGAFTDLDTRFLRALRLLRVFKLARHSAAMDLMLTVIRNEAATVTSALFVMVIIIIVAASGIYLIEHDAQPDAFQSIPQAMWWAAVTLTTVGYGDVVPITVAGKVFGLIITVAGVGMVALPAGILASGFSQELQKRRAEYQLEINESLADGAMSRQELRQLKEKAAELGLSAAEARLLLTVARGASSGPTTCPHCGKHIE